MGKFPMRERSKFLLSTVTAALIWVLAGETRICSSASGAEPYVNDSAEVDYDHLDLAQIDQLAAEEALVTPASAKTLPNVSDDELAGLQGFAQHLAAWYNPPANQRTAPQARFNELLSGGFDAIYQSSADALNQLMRAAASSQAGPPSTPPDLFAVIYGRMFVARNGTFLAAELLDATSPPTTSEAVWELMNKAARRQCAFDLCRQKLRWLADYAVSGGDAARINHLLQAVADVERSVLDKDAHPDSHLDIQKIKTITGFETDLRNLVAKFPPPPAPLAAAPMPTPKAASPAATPAVSPVADAPAAPAKPSPPPAPGAAAPASLRLEARSMAAEGVPDAYKLELLISRPLDSNPVMVKASADLPTPTPPALPGNANAADPGDPAATAATSAFAVETIPLGYEIYNVIPKDDKSWRVASVQGLNAGVDREKLRRCLHLFGAPTWLMPERANNQANPALIVGADLKNVSLDCDLALPALQFGPMLLTVQDESIPWKLHVDETGENAGGMIRQSVREHIGILEKGFANELVKQLDKMRLPLRFRAAVGEGEVASSDGMPAPGAEEIKTLRDKGGDFSENGFTCAVDAQRPGGGSLFSLRLQFSPATGTLTTEGSRFSPQLAESLCKEALRTVQNKAPASLSELAPYARLDDLRFKIENGLPAMEGRLVFDTQPIANVIPAIPVTYHPFDAAGRLSMETVQWDQWARTSLEAMRADLIKRTKGTIEKEIGDLDGRTFTLLPGAGVTAKITNAKRHAAPENFYALDLVLSIAGKECVFKGARLIDGSDSALSLAKFDFTHVQAIPPETVREWVSELTGFDIDGSRVQVSSLALRDDGIHCGLLLDLPELGLTAQSAEIVIGPGLVRANLPALFTDALKKAFTDKLGAMAQDHLGTPELGPLENVGLDPVKTGFEGGGSKVFHLWLRANANVWGGLKVPVSIQVYPKFEFSADEHADILGMVKGFLGGQLELPWGLELQAADDGLIGKNPFSINAKATLKIPKLIEVTIPHICISRDGIGGVDGIEAESEVLTRFLVPAVSTVSGSTICLGAPTLGLSLSHGGSLSIKGKLCLYNENTARLCHLQSVLTASLASARDLSFHLDCELFVLESLKLFHLDGTLDLGRARADCEAQTEGLLDKIVSLEAKAELDFLHGTYSQEGRIGVFHLHLASAQLAIDLPKLLATSGADVNLPLLGDGQASFLAKLGAHPNCELKVRIALKIIGFDLGDAAISINLARTRLLCHACGIRVIISVPTIEVMTPELIASYLASIFRLRWPDLGALLKREIILSPSSGSHSGEGDDGALNPDGIEQQEKRDQNATQTTTTDDTSNHQATGSSSASPTPTAAPPPASTPFPRGVPISLDTKGSRIFPSAMAVQFSAGGAYYQLPATDQTRTWLRDVRKGCFISLAVRNDSIYPLTWYDNDTHAAADTKAPEPLPVKYSQLWPAPPQVEPSLLPFNNTMLRDAAITALGLPFTAPGGQLTVFPPVAADQEQFAGYTLGFPDAAGRNRSLRTISPASGGNQPIFGWLSGDRLGMLGAALATRPEEADKRVYLARVVRQLSQGFSPPASRLVAATPEGSVWLTPTAASFISGDRSRPVQTCALTRDSAGIGPDKNREIWQRVLHGLLTAPPDQKGRPVETMLAFTPEVPVGAGGSRTPLGLRAELTDPAKSPDPEVVLAGRFSTADRWQVWVFKPAPGEATGGYAVFDGDRIRANYEQLGKRSPKARELNLDHPEDQKWLFEQLHSPIDEWVQHFDANPLTVLLR